MQAEFLLKREKSRQLDIYTVKNQAYRVHFHDTQSITSKGMPRVKFYQDIYSFPIVKTTNRSFLF